MKKLLTLAAILLCANALAQDSIEQTLAERKKINRLATSELNAKASKDARKMAKTYVKEGWEIAPGQLPLEKQLDRSYKMYYEYEESGLPKYIRGEAKSTGQFYDAAKMQALEIAKTNLAGMIQTEIVALVESTVANQQLSEEESVSVAKTVQASKNLIAQRLGRVVPVVECYRKTKNGVEVLVTVAYNSRMAYDYAKQVLKEQLEEQGTELHKQLDELWDQNFK